MCVPMRLFASSKFITSTERLPPHHGPKATLIASANRVTFRAHAGRRGLQGSQCVCVHAGSSRTHDRVVGTGIQKKRCGLSVHFSVHQNHGVDQMKGYGKRR
jgi:hypothetical protein